ncbi:MAG: hypothetical protein V2A77_10810 [Pseudomonadota bacterium]
MPTTGDILFTIYQRDGHTFIWAWVTLDQLENSVGAMAFNPELPFNWRDGHKVMASARGAVAQRLARR